MCFLWVGTEYLHNVNMKCTFQRWKGGGVSKWRRTDGQADRMIEWCPLGLRVRHLKVLTQHSFISEFVNWPWSFGDLYFVFTHVFLYFFFVAICIVKFHSFFQPRARHMTAYRIIHTLIQVFVMERASFFNFQSKPRVKLIYRNVVIWLWYFVWGIICSMLNFFCFVSYLTENTMSSYYTRSLLAPVPTSQRQGCDSPIHTRDIAHPHQRCYIKYQI